MNGVINTARTADAASDRDVRDVAAHVIRIQTREDGAQIDQIILSPSRYLNTAPGR